MATPTTLPAAFVAGAILTAAQQNNLRGAFRVLQVVASTYATQTTATTNTFVNSGLTGTITPSSTSSQVLVIVTQPAGVAATCNLGMRLIQTIAAADTTITSWPNSLHSSAGLLYGTFARVSLVSPASIAAVSFRTQMSSTTNAPTVYTQIGNETSTMILAEISA